MEEGELVKGLEQFEIEKDKPIKKSKFPLILIVILICSLVILITVIILLILKINNSDKKNEKDSDDKNEDKNKDKKVPDFYEDELTDFLREAFLGEINHNLTYGNEGIENTFKLGGKNYREEIGPINGNQDYEFNPTFNIYDFYIPYSTLKTNKTKGIILFIHGGGWVWGNKSELNSLSQIYFEHEYIIANMDYTLLDVTNFTIYRILDDITACIKDIIKRLKNRGFNEKELQLAIGGLSAGGHLALLYSYLVKDIPLPVKFIIDIVGPVNLETDDYYTMDKDENTLPDIEPETVNKALKENSYIKPKINDDSILLYLNCFIGKKYTQEELNGMLKDGKIDKKNEKYIELFEKAKYGFPINWMKDKNIPIFAFYGGKDPWIGFVQYARLKETVVKYGITLEFVYSRYGGHAISEYEHPEGIKAAKDFHFYILKFCEDYFTKN